MPIASHYTDLDHHMQQLETEGVDAVISSSAQFGVSGLPLSEACNVAHSLNEERASAQRKYPNRFFGLATLPMQDVDAAIDAADYAITKLGLRGVSILSNIGGQPISHQAFLPIYEKIAQLNTPIVLHPTKTILEAQLRDFGYEYLIGFMVDSSLAALNLVFSGVLNAYPDLKIVHPHLGGIIPYLYGRIDYEYDRPWAFGETLPQPPSDYLRGFYTDTVGFNAGALRLALEFYGVEHVLFGSDHPFWSPSEGINFVRREVDETAAEDILSKNAKQLFGLELDSE